LGRALFSNLAQEAFTIFLPPAHRAPSINEAMVEVFHASDLEYINAININEFFVAACEKH
jgi:hypothetical protein